MGEHDLEEEPVLAPLQTTTRQQTVPAPGWLEELFVEHHQRIYRAAYRITGNPMDAEDVLQTVFLRLLRMQRTDLPSGNPGSYLHLAAVHGALDIMRARGSAKSAPLEDAERLRGRDETDAPDRVSAGREIRERLRQALARLSPRSAEIFALRYFEGYGNREIAKMLDTSQGVVAVVLHRARRQLRHEIGSLVGGTS